MNVRVNANHVNSRKAGHICTEGSILFLNGVCGLNRLFQYSKTTKRWLLFEEHRLASSGLEPETFSVWDWRDHQLHHETLMYDINENNVTNQENNVL